MANPLLQHQSSPPIILPTPSSLPPSPISLPKPPSSNPTRISSRHRISSCFRDLLRIPPPIPFLASASIALPSLAAEAPPTTGDRIDVEAIVVAIDDFFNRNPFFVAGVTFIWLVVIPLVEYQLKKCKPVSAIDAFRKLRDVPSCQLLDIRRRKSLRYLRSPNLKLLNKAAVHVEFTQGQGGGEEDDDEGEGAFLKEVMENFPDPGNTVLCVLDSFDGDSLMVARMLHNIGFKEAYAIKGGLRGKNGWQAIQETLLPPSMHVNPRKKNKASIDVNEKKASKNDSLNGQPVSSLGSGRELKENADDLHKKLSETTVEASEKPSSP